MFRKTEIDWTGFSKLRNETNRKIEAAICNTCKIILPITSPHRFDFHRKKCFKAYTERSTAQDNSADFFLMNEEFDTVDKDDLEKVQQFIHMILAKFFVSANIPFKEVENKYFSDFVHALLSCKFKYKAPCKQELSTTVFQKLYNEVIGKKECLLKDTESVLLVDEWTNKCDNSKYLVFSLRNMNTRQTFLSITDMTIEREEEDNFAAKINEAIREAKEVYDTDVYGIVTNNNMKIIEGARLAETVDNKKLIQSTCSSESGSLLIKSFVDNDFENAIQDIVHAFKDTELEVLMLSHGGTKLKSFDDTHFYYLRDCCVSILKNIKIMQSILQAESSLMYENFTNHILCADFHDRLKDLIDLLDPICKMIDTCQSPECNIADATEQWLNLTLLSEQQNDVLFVRRDKTLWPVAYAANLLHHKYRGKYLDKAQRLVATEFLDENMDDQVKEEYDTYLATDKNFQFYADNCNDPVAYWLSVASKLPNLSKFVIKLMIVPGSTALVESLLSNWTYVHNSQRNRLVGSEAAYLIDVYYTLIRQTHSNHTFQ